MELAESRANAINLVSWFKILGLGGGPRKESCGCVRVAVGCCVCGNALGLRTTLCTTHSHTHHTDSTRTECDYTFLADAVSPPLSHRRKIPITIDRARPPAPAAASDRFDLAGWLSHNHERQRARSPSPSPTRDELEDMAAQMNAEEAEAATRRSVAADVTEARHAEPFEFAPFNYTRRGVSRAYDQLTTSDLGPGFYR
ncbi:hypothetical protein DFH09DRAFT_1312419 [Mycena vulgaris]|nr:hypothetical protein DFH09DRAFT_1312419 [Mycena vulgaris]